MMHLQNQHIHQNFAYITSWHKISNIHFSNYMWCVHGTHKVFYDPSKKLDRRSNGMIYADLSSKLNFLEIWCRIACCCPNISKISKNTQSEKSGGSIGKK